MGRKCRNRCHRPGRAAIGFVLRAHRTAFPDRHYQIDDLIAEGDLVACRLTVSGTFGTRPERPPFPTPPDWLGVEGTELVDASATGKSYSVQQMHIFRIRDGKISDHWAARNDLRLLIQVGAVSVPAVAVKH